MHDFPLDKKGLRAINEEVRTLNNHIIDQINKVVDTLAPGIIKVDTDTLKFDGVSIEDAIRILKVEEKRQRDQLYFHIRDQVRIDLISNMDAWQVNPYVSEPKTEAVTDTASPQKETESHAGGMTDLKGSFSEEAKASKKRATPTTPTVETMDYNTIRSSVIHRIPEEKIRKVVNMFKDGESDAVIQTTVKLSEELVSFIICEYAGSDLTAPTGLSYHSKKAVKDLWREGYDREFIAIRLRVSLADVNETIQGITEYNVEESTIKWVNSMKDSNSVQKIQEITGLRIEVVNSIIAAPEDK